MSALRLLIYDGESLGSVANYETPTSFQEPVSVLNSELASPYLDNGGETFADLLADANGAGFFDGISAFKQLDRAFVWDQVKGNFFEVDLQTELAAAASGELLIIMLLNEKPLFGDDPDHPFDSLAGLLALILNGGSKGEGYDCPCNNATVTEDFCNASMWSVITKTTDFPLDGATTRLAPCMDPGKEMVVFGGIEPYASATAQVKRIRNLDRIKFFTGSVKYKVKSCSKSVVFRLQGQTCGVSDYDSRTETDTALTVDLSVQLTVLGTSILNNACDSIPPAEPLVQCNENVGCLTIKVPATFLTVTFEVPLKDDENPLNTPICNLLNPPPASQSVTLDWGKATLKMDFSMTEKPVISGVVVNDEYLRMLEIAIMQATNTSMRSVLDTLLMEKLGPKLAEFFKTAGALTQWITSCVRFPEVSKIECIADQTPVIPEGGCDPCDDCCLCATGGLCTEKCLQLCPCTTKFCSDVNRIFTPIWKIFTVLFVIGLIFSVFMLSNAARALRR